MMMPGNDCWNRNVFSRFPLPTWERWWRLEVDRQGILNDGCCNRKRATADGCQTARRDEQLKCRWQPQTTNSRRPDRCNTGKSWFKTPTPCHAVLDMPWAPVWSCPVPEDAASEISRGRRSPRRWNQVPNSFPLPHTGLSEIPDSLLLFALVSSSFSLSPLPPFISPPVFHSRSIT